MSKVARVAPVRPEHQVDAVRPDDVLALLRQHLPVRLVRGEAELLAVVAVDEQLEGPRPEL